MTVHELAIARGVIYASLFDYPLTLDQLHHALIESDQSPSEIEATYAASERLQRVIGHRDGFFFPAGRDDLVAERRHREARSRAFLQRYRFVLRLICAVPFTRMVALSGSIAHLNLERGGDLDLFIVTRGRHVWTVAVMVLLLTKCLGRRRIVCANLVLADSRLALDQQDLFTANQVIHLKPLIGEDVLDDFLAANPFVRRLYPNALAWHPHRVVDWPPGGFLQWMKAVLEIALRLPSPWIEAGCRRLYRWYLRRRAAAWESPEQVRLDPDFLKLHTRSHRHSVLDRFERAVADAWRRANRSRDRAVAPGRHR
jgi:hypothetical protein